MTKWHAVIKPINPEDESQMLIEMEITFKAARYDIAAGMVGEFIRDAHLIGAEIDALYEVG